MRIKNKFKGHYIEKSPKLNYTNISDLLNHQILMQILSLSFHGDQSVMNRTFPSHLIELGEIAPFLPEI